MKLYNTISKLMYMCIEILVSAHSFLAVKKRDG
jgi:hypothetical protein